MTPWFKNLLIYRLNSDIDLSAERLENDLAAMRFTGCTSQDKITSGWVSPLGRQSELLAHTAGQQMLLCIRKEEKILPAPVIKQRLQARIDDLENKQNRKLKKAEKDTLKDEVIQELLPRAFSRFSQTWLWIDTQRQLIMIDAASSKRAEESLALLRKSLGSLPVIPLAFASPISQTLTGWVRDNVLPGGLILGDEAELKATETEGGVIRCKQQDLSGEEIAGHLARGKQVTQLLLSWHERIAFVLTEDAALKRLKFSETLREENTDIDKADFAQRFDADFLLMSGELSQLVENLILLLGSNNDQ